MEGERAVTTPAGQAEVGRDQLATLRRGMPLVLVTTAIVTLLAVGLSLRQESLYQATAEVFVSAQPLDNAAASALSFLSSDPERVLATQAKVARVPAVAKLAVEEGGGEISPTEFLGTSSVTRRPRRRRALVLGHRRRCGNGPEPRKCLRERLRRCIAANRTRAPCARPEPRSTSRLPSFATAGQPRATPRWGGCSRTAKPCGLASCFRGRTAPLAGRPRAQRRFSLARSATASWAECSGLALGIGLVFVRNALNTRVRSATEIEERLGIPLLGRVPPPPRRLASANRLAVIEEPHSTQSEAYRMLATNIELLNLDRGAKSFMVASAIRGEGKSTTSASLAVTFARRGLHVVLLEADLRRPMLEEVAPARRGARPDRCRAWASRAGSSPGVNPALRR